MPQTKAKLPRELTEVPAAWPLGTVIDAFAYLCAFKVGYAPADRAHEVVSFRLVELWAAQPEEAEAWLERCRESFATPRGHGDEAGEALRGAAPARSGRVGEVRVARFLALLPGGAPSRRAQHSSAAGALGGCVPASALHPRSLPGARGAARGGGEHGDGAEAAEAPAPKSGAPEVAAREPRAQQSPGRGGVQQACGAPSSSERGCQVQRAM